MLRLVALGLSSPGATEACPIQLLETLPGDTDPGPCDRGNPRALRFVPGGRTPTLASGMKRSCRREVKKWLIPRIVSIVPAPPQPAQAKASRLCAPSSTGHARARPGNPGWPARNDCAGLPLGGRVKPGPDRLELCDLTTDAVDALENTGPDLPHACPVKIFETSPEHPGLVHVILGARARLRFPAACGFPP